MFLKRVNPDQFPHGAITPADWDLLCRSLERAARLAKRSKFGVWFIEVGTLSAKTTEGIVKVLDYCEVKTHVLTIDKSPGSQEMFDRRLKAWRGFPLVSFSLGYTRDALKEFKDDIAWAFIDGCHCAGCVWDDIRCIAPHVIPGGMMVFHDADPRNRALGMTVHKRYHGDGVTRLYGVNRAISCAEEMQDFDLVESVPAIERPPGSPTPIFGGAAWFVKRES